MNNTVTTTITLPRHINAEINAYARKLNLSKPDALRHLALLGLTADANLDQPQPTTNTPQPFPNRLTA